VQPVFLGLNKTVELSHKTENLIAKIRDEKIPFTEDIINALFDALEKLKILTENIALTGEEGDIDIEPEIIKIQRIIEKIQGGIVTDFEEKFEEKEEKLKPQEQIQKKKKLN